MKRFSWVPKLLLVALCLALAGLPQPAACAVDTTPPTGTIIINSNRSATNSRTVTIAMTWSDGTGSGVARMRFSDNGSTWSAYESLTPSRSHTLPVGADGHRTVRVQFIDLANNRSATYSDYILLDRTAPTGSVIINGGATTTTTLAVSLGLTWGDGAGSQVSRMRFSDNGSTWTAWETPTATRAHTLPAGLGNHTVRVQYLDGAGNYSPVYNDYIKLVATATAGTTDTVLLPGDVPLVMVWIPGGTVMMGRYPGEVDSDPSEDPQHWVTVGGYWMAKYQLTKRQWQAVMGTTPWSGKSYVLDDPDSPAVYVSWNNAHSFLTAVNSYTGKTFRLPSEAQWEYACRAGTQTRFYWGDDPGYTAIGYYAWCSDNSLIEQYSHVVGRKIPNGLGLYDMSGNVFQWCEDDWHESYTGAPTGGQAWVDTPRGYSRVFRGGSWNVNVFNCRSAARYSYYGGSPAFGQYDIGFRLSK